MIIIPAIDIINKKCVRLKQGDYNRKTIYADDPIVVAKNWETQGAKKLHIVDLDGARQGKLTNFETIKQISKKTNIPIQVGGGIRSMKKIKKMLSIRISKVILSTIALEDEESLKNLLKSYSKQIIISLDSENGKLAKRGWLNKTNIDLIKTAKKLEKLGVKQFIYTNVLKDGTLTQPDYKEIKLLQKSIKAPLTAAGGISSITAIKKLKAMKIQEVIIGKALYEKKIDLKEVNNVS